MILSLPPNLISYHNCSEFSFQTLTILLLHNFHQLLKGSITCKFWTTSALHNFHHLRGLNHITYSQFSSLAGFELQVACFYLNHSALGFVSITYTSFFSFPECLFSFLRWDLIYHEIVWTYNCKTFAQGVAGMELQKCKFFPHFFHLNAFKWFSFDCYYMILVCIEVVVWSVFVEYQECVFFNGNG